MLANLLGDEEVYEFILHSNSFEYHSLTARDLGRHSSSASRHSSSNGQNVNVDEGFDVLTQLGRVHKPTPNGSWANSINVRTEDQLPQQPPAGWLIQRSVGLMQTPPTISTRKTSFCLGGEKFRRKPRSMDFNPGYDAIFNWKLLVYNLECFQFADVMQSVASAFHTPITSRPGIL